MAELEPAETLERSGTLEVNRTLKDAKIEADKIKSKALKTADIALKKLKEDIILEMEQKYGAKYAKQKIELSKTLQQAEYERIDAIKKRALGLVAKDKNYIPLINSQIKTLLERYPSAIIHASLDISDIYALVPS